LPRPPDPGGSRRVPRQRREVEAPVIDRSMVADAEHLRLEVAATAGPAPTEWIDILGPTFGITVERNGLDVGTLTASIADAVLDPASAETVQPGKQLRLLANIG